MLRHPFFHIIGKFTLSYKNALIWKRTRFRGNKAPVQIGICLRKREMGKLGNRCLVQMHERMEFMTRREIREQIFQLLFRIEFHKGDEMPEQIQLFFESIGQLGEKNQTYMEQKYDEIVVKLKEIDESINQVAKGWQTSRMSKVDLTIIRLAVYEMKYDEEIPLGVAINEAVEIAKKYGGEDSPSFVNGILAKLA